jgi:hypothetical protein
VRFMQNEKLGRFALSSEYARNPVYKKITL